MAEQGGLEAVGVAPGEEAVYRVLLSKPEATLQDLARDAGMSAQQTRALLRGLEQKGLATRHPGRPDRFSPVAPDVAIDALVHRRQQQLAEARLLAERLMDSFRDAAAADRAADFVHVLEGNEAVSGAFSHMQAVAREEIMAFAKPPYASPRAEAQGDLLARGVHLRVLYDEAFFDIPDAFEAVAEATRAGEEARVLASVPMKMLIVDGSRALVPMTLSEPGCARAVAIDESPLLEALKTLFEVLWAQATPINPNGVAAQPALSDDDVMLLQMLVAGRQDKAIARQLGIDVRTVRRRVARLMRMLSVRTRFQAGAQAVRRGWI